MTRTAWRLPALLVLGALVMQAAWILALPPFRAKHHDFFERSHRFLGWTMALLPTPNNWIRAQQIFLPLGERALKGDLPTREELHAATLDAFSLRASTVAPLLDWTTE